jgi:hypothetical protein
MCEEPKFDKYGYPTEHTLQCIKNWDWQDPLGALEYMREAWYWQHMVDVEGNKWIFRTGGWSGNEELISAIEDNYLLYNMVWVSSDRGGKYVFAVHMI